METLEEIFAEEDAKVMVDSLLQKEVNRLIPELWLLRAKYVKAKFSRHFDLGTKDTFVFLTEYDIHIDIADKDFKDENKDKFYELMKYETSSTLDLSNRRHVDVFSETVKPELVDELLTLLKSIS